jgi:hypothetical protein
MFDVAFSRGGQTAQQLLSSYAILRGNVVLSYGIGLVAFIAAIVFSDWLDRRSFPPFLSLHSFLRGSP